MARVATMKPGLRTFNTRIATVPRADVVQRSAKPTEDFYGSAAWKAIRLQVQRECNRVCQWPGCGKANTRIYVDHIVERRDGGAPLERSNLMGLCASCHGKKTARERAKREAR